MEVDQQQRARQLALAMRSQMVLTAEDEEVLWWLLQRHATTALCSGQYDAMEGGNGSVDGGASGCGELCLNYDDFTQVAAECREAIGPSADVYFQASTFLRLARDAGGCVPAAALFRYCAARSAQIQLRGELGLLDPSGSGTLSPQQLHLWLERHAPLTACSEALVSEGDWCIAVVARLLMLHGRRGRLLIRDLLGSPEVHELTMALHALEAAEAAAAAAAAAADGGSVSAGGGIAAPAMALTAAIQQQSWFSPAAAAALRLRFSELDADRDGLLSQLEFASFSQGTMTQLAVQRLFSHHCGGGNSNSSGDNSTSGPPRGGGMDFAAFCAFCAAWEQRHHPAAIRYFFPLLDLRGGGYVGQRDLYTFFREVHVLWVALGQYAELRVEDVLAEANDLLQAPNPDRITAADLQRCGAAGTIIGLLLDVNLFWEYENREALLQQQQQQATQQVQAMPYCGSGTQV